MSIAILRPTEMRTAFFAALLTLIPGVLCAADRWWITDSSDPNATRQADYRLASRIELTGGAAQVLKEIKGKFINHELLKTTTGVVRLLAEHEGKLVPYFESKDLGGASGLLANLGYNTPGSYFLMGDGAFVVSSAVVSIEYRNEAGGETCILRGFSAELGRTAEAKMISVIKDKFKK